jgi:hypothetical protein
VGGLWRSSVVNVAPFPNPSSPIKSSTDTVLSSIPSSSSADEEKGVDELTIGYDTESDRGDRERDRERERARGGEDERGKQTSDRIHHTEQRCTQERSIRCVCVTLCVCVCV